MKTHEELYEAFISALQQNPTEFAKQFIPAFGSLLERREPRPARINLPQLVPVWPPAEMIPKPAFRTIYVQYDVPRRVTRFVEGDAELLVTDEVLCDAHLKVKQALFEALVSPANLYSYGLVVDREPTSVALCRRQRAPRREKRRARKRKLRKR